MNLDDLLKQLTIDDLHGDTRDLAETIGMEAFLKLVEVYGGTGRLYIPQASILTIPIRNTQIREEYDGTNLANLCRKWGLSENSVRKIVRPKK